MAFCTGTVKEVKPNDMPSPMNPVATKSDQIEDALSNVLMKIREIADIESPIMPSSRA